MKSVFIKPKPSVFMRAVGRSYFWYLAALALLLGVSSVGINKQTNVISYISFGLILACFILGNWDFFSYMWRHSFMIYIGEDGFEEYRFLKKFKIDWPKVFSINVVHKYLCIYAFDTPTTMIDLSDYGQDGREKIVEGLREINKSHDFTLRWYGRSIENR